MKKIPVVIFGDHIAAYGIIRAFRRTDIPVFMVSKTGKGLSMKSHSVRKRLILKPDDDNFIAKMNGWLAKQCGGAAVLMVAGDDDYLDVIAKGYHSLLPALKPTFPDWNVVSLVRQKARTYRLAEELDIPIPRTQYVTSRVELESLFDKGVSITFPVLMKCEESHRFSSKFRTKGIVCNNRSEVFQSYDKHDAFFGKLLLQEMVPGGEECLFCLKTVLNRASQALAVFVDKKLRSAKRFSSCTMTASTWSDDVVEHGLRLLARIGYYGYAAVEFKFDERNSVFKLMEINGRVSMNHSHALGCGINLPMLMYDEALKGPLPPLEKIRQTYPDNILWWMPFEDVASIYNSCKNRTFRLVKYLRSFVGKGYIIEPLSLYDPYPGIVSMGQMLRGVAKKIFSAN